MRNTDAAYAALQEYAKRVGDSSEPLEAQAEDLITDLLHLVDADGDTETDALTVADRARFHFEYEKEGRD